MDELITEIAGMFAAAADKRELISAGYKTLSLPYCSAVIQKVWPLFLARMRQLDAVDHHGHVVGVDFSGLFHAYFFIHEDRAAQEVCEKIERLRTMSFGTLDASAGEFIIALDSDDGYWRKSLFPGYKSTRKAKPDGFQEIEQKAISLLRQAGFRMEQHTTHESDDVLSSIAFMAKVRKQQAVLITDDKDLYQCLGPGVTIYAPRAKQLRDADWLMETLHVTPKQFIDWLCLVGKDDIPSPDNIGDITASKWLQQYGSVLGLHDAREVLTEKKRTTLEQYVTSDYWLARDLHTLKKNLDIFW